MKAGYKQTEVGVIPEDWEAMKLDSFISKLEAGVSVNSVADGEGSSSFKILKTSCAANGKFDPNEAKEIAPKDIKRAKLNPSPNSIIISRMNTPDLVGESGFVKEHFSGLFLPDRLWLTQHRKDVPHDVQWLANCLAYPPVSAKIKAAATGTSGSMKNLSKSALLSAVVPAPTNPDEQKAIAGALSDVDGLIAGLEALIAKKRSLKTATMQQLLTGKTRLAGFGIGVGMKQTELGEIPEDWDAVELGTIGVPVIGLTYKPSDVSEDGILVLRSSNIQNENLSYENNVFVKHELPDRVITREGDLLICVRNGSRSLIGKCALIDETAAGSAFGAFMSLFKSDYSQFIYFQFKSRIIKKQIEDTMGATINQITNKDLKRFCIPFPPTDDERSAIITVLTDSEAEIRVIEGRLAKAKALKQGMMQELLTGRTRLI